MMVTDSWRHNPIVARRVSQFKKIRVAGKSLLFARIPFDLLYKPPARMELSPVENVKQVFDRLTSLVEVTDRIMIDRSSSLARREGLNPFEHGKAFPWISWNQLIVRGEVEGINIIATSANHPDYETYRELSSVERLINGFDVSRALLGQRYDGRLEVGEIVSPAIYFNPGRTRSRPTFIAKLELESLRFEEGSIVSIAKGQWWVPLILTPIFSGCVQSAMSKIGDSVHTRIQDHKFERRVENLQADTFTHHSLFHISGDQLEDLSSRAFNYEEEGISPYERERRIHMTQLAISMLLKSGLIIDDTVGPETTESLKAIARQYGTSSSIADPFLRRILAWALTRPSEREGGPVPR
jgi:hypothetical protein